MNRVKVFLNRQKDDEGRYAIFTRFRDEAVYQDGDELEHVLTYDVEGLYQVGEEMKMLERVFSDLNRGSPTFIGDERYPQRSLSAGDVVEIGTIRFICERVGFVVEDFNVREKRMLASAADNRLRSEWCKHDPSCEFRCYPADGECECGMYRHHVHGTCGGVTQVG